MLLAGLALHMYTVLNLTPLQKTVKKLGFKHKNMSETIDDAYIWHPKDEPTNYCNSSISISVYDIYPNAIHYSCEVSDNIENTQFGYSYSIETGKLTIENLDFSHEYKIAEDKALYEKVYNESFKQYNEEILDKLEN